MNSRITYTKQQIKMAIYDEINNRIKEKLRSVYSDIQHFTESENNEYNKDYLNEIDKLGREIKKFLIR